MKKEVSIVCIVIAILLLSIFILSSCFPSLPKGRASAFVVSSTNNSSYDYGSGKFKYLNESTVKFVSDRDGKTYYFSTEHIKYIKKESK